MSNKKILTALMLGSSLISINSANAQSSFVMDPQITVGSETLTAASAKFSSVPEITIEVVPTPTTPISAPLDVNINQEDDKSNILDVKTKSLQSENIKIDNKSYFSNGLSYFNNGVCAVTNSLTYASVKTVGGFIGTTLLTDNFVKYGLSAVENGTLYFTGSPWLAKAMRVALYDQVYNIAVDSAFVIGFNAPDVAVSTARAISNAVSNPYETLGLITELSTVGIKLVSTQLGSYLLTQPIHDLVGQAAYYSMFAATGNPLLAHAACVTATGAMHMSGIGHKAARAAGYMLPSVIYNLGVNAKNLVLGVSDKEVQVTSETVKDSAAEPTVSSNVTLDDKKPLKKKSYFGKAKSYFKS